MERVKKRFIFAEARPLLSAIRHIALCALTYHRPEGLAALLAGIAALDCPHGVRVTVVIVDNSAEATAQAQVAAAALPFARHYVHCPQRGLSPARNAALDAAVDLGADALGFIDDDEVPETGWIAAHLAALMVAEVSLGRVRAAYEAPPANWMRRGGFHDIDGFARHQPLGFGCTSNVMMRLEAVRACGARFDDRFALTGGEDTHFFHLLMRSGAWIVFAPEAVVTETIVASRARLGWLWRRWRRTGQTNAMIRLLDRGNRDRAVCLAGGLLRLGAGGGAALLALPATLAGRFDLVARPLRIAARGLGFIDGALGRVTEEYRVMTR
ncbi:glycosyltransferase family 2 protein [Halovulum sp. GXIMD14793]